MDPIKSVNYDAREDLGSRNAGNSVASGVKKADDKLTKSRKRRTDKSDRATVENVLDRRTRTVAGTNILSSSYHSFHVNYLYTLFFDI